MERININKEKLYNLYITKELSSIKIGKMFNCNNMTICSRLREFGISVRPRKLDINKEELRNLYVIKKMSAVGVSRMFKCTRTTIRNRLREFGIPTRSKEELIKACLRRRIPSSLEEQFQDIINKHNLPYKYVGNGEFILGSYNPDFINTNSEKIAVEVYVRYYKRRNEVGIEEWKKKRSEVFKSYGWTLLFFDEIEVSEKNVLKVLRPKRKLEYKNEFTRSS